MPKTSTQIGITVYGIDKSPIADTTVTIANNISSTTETTDSDGHAVLNLGNLTNWTSGDSVTVTVSIIPPTVEIFTVNPTSIPYGKYAILYWITANAKMVTISEVTGPHGLSGTAIVSPTESTTYKF